MVTCYVIQQMNQTDKFKQVFVRRGPHRKSCTLHVQIIKYEISLTLTLQNKSSNTVYDQFK